MANYENARIFTEDDIVRKIISEKYLGDRYYYFPETEHEMLRIRNREGQTRKELLEISLLYNAQILAQYSFESNGYALTHTEKIDNGSCELWDIKVNYIFDFPDEFKLYVEKESQNQIFDKLAEFYRTVDKVNIYEEGIYNYNLNKDKEIIIKLDIDDYYITAIKIGNEIKIESFKYIA